MDFNTLIVDRYGRDDLIGRITLNRPEKINALSSELLGELETALGVMAKDDTIRVIVIRGSGRGFGAGYDCDRPRGNSSDGSTFDDGNGILSGEVPLHHTVREFRQ